MNALDEAEAVAERAQDAYEAAPAPTDGPGDWMPWGLALFVVVVVVRAIMRGARAP